MDTLHQALRAASQQQPQPLISRQTLLVVGGGGVLGSAVLAQALVAGRFLQVLALVAEPLASAMRGLLPLPLQALQGKPALPAQTALIIFERERRSNGRDDAFVQPQVADLLPLAQALRQRGVRRLMVLVPHAPALLPQALSHGLANLDEAAVVALGFEQLVLLRAAQPARAAGGGSRLQRFAGWWLSQLSWMVPQRQQPLPVQTLAQGVVLLAQALPHFPPGTRVVAPEALWVWAQHPQGLAAALAAEWAAAPGA